jgi:hypothetical protein
MSIYDANPAHGTATVNRNAPERCTDCEDRRLEGERGERRWCLDHRYTVGGWRRPARTY